jgi:hypothetical protein
MMRPYLQTLPDRAALAHLPIFWTDAELDEHLGVRGRSAREGRVARTPSKAEFTAQTVSTPPAPFACSHHGLRARARRLARGSSGGAPTGAVRTTTCAARTRRSPRGARAPTSPGRAHASTLGSSGSAHRRGR